MKQTNFLKSLFLLFALIVGSSSVWADEQTFTPGTDTGETSVTKGAVTATMTTMNNASYYQIYGGQSGTFTCSGGNITKIEFTCTASGTSKYGPGNASANVGSYSYSGSTGTWSGNANSVTISTTAQIRMSVLKITYNVTPSHTITAQSNNDSYGTVSLDGSTITASPEEGYRVIAGDGGYTVTTGTATVTNNGDNTFSVTPSTDCTVTINFEAIPTYTVTFDAEGGSCGTTSDTETIGGAGVTLPTATPGVAGWEFIGWAADAVDNTTTQPTLYKACSTYYPTIDTELHAVYTLSETGYAYTRVTSASQIAFAKKIAVASSRSTSRILNHSATTVTAPTETTGEITLSSDQMFALSGDNTTGYVLTGASGTLSQENLSTSDGNDKPIDWSGTNNKWIIEVNTNADNLFALRNAASDKAALEFDSGWKTYYVGTYTSSPYTAMKLYIPKTAYNSKPSAIITPTVAFGSADPVTLYLDGTTENTNTATVTGVSKTINYTSSNTDVATVNSDGIVTAVGIGTTTITASVDAELGVSAAAYDTYEVTVKSATTISGLKTIDSTSGKAFTADLTNAVVTYVKGSYAYIQDASAAILVNKSDHGLVAGQKINGAVSGTVKITNSIDQLTDIDLSAATVTEDGVIPAALTKTVAEVRANAASLDGQLVTINAVTIDKPSTTTTLRDGSKIGEEEATITMFSPNGGASVTNKEKGNFTGYISLYNGETPRINLYEQSQFKKTHNAPQNQVMSFTNNSYNLDEETDAVTSFAGQEVTKTTVKGAVTYAITGDAIGTVNAETGVVTLNGDCGTATIVATAAAYDEYDEGTGYYTPYKELTKEYSVTVRPRYTVTFSANGQETEVRQESYGDAVTIPTIAPVGNYEVQGWLDEEIDTPTDTEPVELIVESTYTPTNDITLYAVYAKQTIVPNVEQTSTFTFKKSSGSSPTVNNEGTWTFASVTFVNSNNCGLNNQSITVTPSANVTSIKEVTVRKTANTWGKNVTLTMTDASSNQIFQVKTGDFTSNLYTSDLTDHQSSSYTFASSGMAYVENIVLTYLASVLAYADYRTSLTNATVTMTIGPAGFNTWHQPFAAEFIAEGDNGKAYYAADVDANQVVNFQQFSENKIPANTGAIIKGEVNAEVSYTILDDDVDFSAENLLHGTNTTETITADDDYYYFISGRTKVSEDPLTYEYGFFVPKSLETGSTFTNNANKAYLQVLKTKFGGATSKGLGMSWTDAETNGITNVNSTYADGHYYNLAGQRVSENYKGVVIYNGKKIIKK